MIPILQTQTEVIGFLPDALSCTVTEERNGIYELELTYPVSGPMFSSLAVDKFIKAKPNDTASDQLFRIYEISKPINGIVTIEAEHISYALSHYPVDGVSGSYTSAQAISAILTKANANLKSSHGFSVSTTGMTAVKDFSFSVGSARSALGGTDGSVLDTYGGEFEFDNKVIKLHSARGLDTGVIIAYGKNLTDIKATTSMESSYTHLFPYVLKDETLTTITDKTIAVTNKSGIAERVLLKDFSSEFSSDETISADTLLTKANAWLADNDINTPSINVTVSFIHLWQSPEYESLAALEKVSLCDTVTIYHADLGVNIKAKVIKTVYDSLGEKYEKIELGSSKANFSDTISQKVNDATSGIKSELESDISSSESAITIAYNEAIDKATKAITGYSGGYVVLNPSENPQELLIMNTADKATATKLWRWNLGGLGYSNTGYNGTYNTAITMDGAVNADFITTGTLTANIIKAGVLQSSDGNSFFNLESGLIQTNNANITGGSIKIGGDSYNTEIAYGSLRQSASSGINIGGLVPVSSSGVFSQCLYYIDNGTSDAVCISYQDTDTQAFPLIASFNKDLITFKADLTLPDNIVKTASSVFSGFAHTRNNITLGSSTVSRTVKPGVGIVTSHYASYSFSEYKNSSMSQITSGGHTYWGRKSLSSVTYYRMTNNISCSDATKAYVSFIANSYGKAYIYLCYTTSSGTLVPYIQLATPWGSETSYSGQITLPSEASSWCLYCKPDTASTSYWCAVRDVSLRNYYQDTSAALEQSDSSGNIRSRIDVFGSWGEAVGAIRLMSGSNVSSIMEFGDGELYYDSKPILSWLQELDDRVSALE